MIVTLNHMHILYIYIIPLENSHNGTVAYFIKLEFSTKLAWALYALTFTKSLDLPCYFMFFLVHYEYLHGLAILDEDTIGADLGDYIEFDLSHF